MIKRQEAATRPRVGNKRERFEREVITTTRTKTKSVHWDWAGHPNLYKRKVTIGNEEKEVFCDVKGNALYNMIAVEESTGRILWTSEDTYFAEMFNLIMANPNETYSGTFTKTNMPYQLVSEVLKGTRNTGEAKVSFGGVTYHIKHHR